MYMSEASFTSPPKRPIDLDGLMGIAYNREATLNVPDETLQTTLNHQLFTPDLLSKPVDITAMTSHPNSEGEPILGVEQFSEAVARFEVSSELGERTVRLALDNGDSLELSHIMEIRQQEPEEEISDYNDLIHATGKLVDRVLSRESFNSLNPVQQQLLMQRLTEKATTKLEDIFAESEHCQAILKLWQEDEPIIADNLRLLVPGILGPEIPDLTRRCCVEILSNDGVEVVPFIEITDLDLIYPEQENDDQSVDYLATFQDEWRSQSIQATEYLLNDRVTDLSQRNISAERVTKLMQAEASELCAQLMADENFLTEHMLEAGKFYVDGTFYTNNNGEWQEMFDDLTINAKPELHCEEVDEQWRFGLRLVPIDDDSQADVFVVPNNNFLTAFQRSTHKPH